MASKEQMIDFIIRASTDSGFHGTFSKAQESFTKLGKEIQNLQRVQRDVASYQKQQEAVEKTNAKLENLKEQYNKLQEEIEQTEGPTASLERESLKLGQRIRETTNAFETQKQKLNATGDRLQEARVDTNDLTRADAQLTEQIRDLRAEQDRAAESAANYGKTASTSFTAAGQALAAAGIVAGLKKITDAYRSCVQTSVGFGASMSNVGALSGASDSELSALSTKAKAMGAATKFTATESADAFGYMALAGWDAQKQIAGIGPVLNLATAANMDLAKASDIVTDYLTAFGLTANDTTGFVDKMAYAMSRSNTDVIQLGEAYKGCASTAKSMHYSVEDTTAVLMGMANAGVKGSEAGTALNAVMTRLATDTKGCATALAEYDVNVYDAEGNMNSLSEILSGMSRMWTTLSDAEQAALAKTIAGTSHYSDLQIIMNACSKEAEASGQSFSDYAAALQNCGGTAAQQAEKMLDNLSGDLVKMDSALEAVQLTLGEQFTPELRKLTQFGTGALNVLNQAMEKSPAAAKMITTFTGIMTLATGAVAAYGAAAKAAKALELGTMFASAGPVLGVTAAIGGLTAAIIGVREAQKEATPEAWALNEATSELRRTLDDSSTAYEEARDKALASAEVAGQYIDKLDNLGSAESRTAEQNEEYQRTVETLLQVMPDLSDCFEATVDQYGRTTYAAKETTAAMREQAEAAKEAAIANAISAARGDIMTEYGDVLLNQQLSSRRKAEAEETKKTAEAELKQLNKQQEDFYQAAEREAVRLGKLGEQRTAEDVIDDRYFQNQKRIAELDSVIANAESDIWSYGNALANSADEAADAEAKLAELDEIQKEMAGDTKSAAEAVEGMGGSFAETQEAAQAFKDSLTEISDGAMAVAKAYQEAYDSAYGSVSGQYGLLETAAQAVPTGLDAIQQALETQAGYWDSYGQNLETLQKRAEGIAGLGEYLTRVADGSSESANILAGLVGLSDDQLAGIAKADQELQAKWDSISQQLTDMRGDWEDELDEWRSELETTISEMDQSDEAREAVEETIKGFIEAANDPTLRAELREAFAGLARSARIEIGSANGYVSTAGIRDGYASGTRNAERGWKLVGEEGPELMFFNGGESVLNARETASALDNAAKYEAAYDAPPAAETSVNVNINLAAGAPRETVDALKSYVQSGELRKVIQNVINESERDRIRRSFAT